MIKLVFTIAHMGGWHHTEMPQVLKHHVLMENGDAMQ